MSVITSEIPTSSEAISGSSLSTPFVIKPILHPPGTAGSSRVVTPISGPGFHYELETELVSGELIDADRFMARFTVDYDVDFFLTLVGRQIDQGRRFESGQFFLNVQVSKSRPRAHFVASTLKAIFALAGGLQLRIPELEIDQRLDISVPLPHISTLLKSRQMALRLMVIEKAAGAQFLLPQAISLADKAALDFVYHAIVDRSFIWHSAKIGAFTSAEFAIANIPSHQPFRFSFVLDPFPQTIFGNVINLGLTTITIEEAVVKNVDAVRREIETNDGHQVQFEVESLRGQEQYDFLDAPRLPDAPWDSKISDLIELDPQLDSALFESYNALAAATLEGLTEEQKTEITARSPIGAAFVIEDSSLENI